MKFLFSFLALFVLPLTSFKTKLGVLPHPFYISVTEISHNAAAKSLEVSCKFFADDMEQTLEKAYATRLDIAAATDKVRFDKYIPDYINRHLQCSVDGKPVALAYIGYEKEKESVYCYFEVLNVTSPKQLDVTNSLLHDFTKEQLNIMHVTVGGKRQSTKLDFPQTKAGFRF